jgi:hypothetical protein
VIAELFGLAGDPADGFGRGERPDVGQVDSELQGDLLARRNVVLDTDAI